MNINQLKYFVSVGECRSFSKAAEQNFISQTAIIQQIKSLENTIGTTLVERGKRPIELTPAGRVFMQEAKAILERLELVVNRTHAAEDGLEGEAEIEDIIAVWRNDDPNIVLKHFLSFFP